MDVLQFPLTILPCDKIMRIILPPRAPLIKQEIIVISICSMCGEPESHKFILSGNLGPRTINLYSVHDENV